MIIKEFKHLKLQSIFLELNNKSNANLIVHVSSLSTIESNNLKFYCRKNLIKLHFIKINLLKRLTKNTLYRNLFKGPTCILFFPNIWVLNTFIDQSPVNKKIIPLMVSYNGFLFSYQFFIYSIKLLENLKVLNKRDSFLYLLKNFPNNNIKSLILRNFFIKFFYVLKICEYKFKI